MIKTFILDPFFKKNLDMLHKFSALSEKHRKEFSDPNTSFGQVDQKPLFNILKILIIGGGSIYLLMRLGLKFTDSFSKDKIKELEKLREALLDTHTPEQKRLWEDIAKTQKSTNSLRETLVDVNKSKDISKFDLIKIGFLSKREKTFKSQEKWLGIQLRKYEDSLNNNQLTIYRNLFDTELEVVRRSKVVKSLIYVGIPLLGLAVLSPMFRKQTLKFENDLKRLDKNKEKALQELKGK